MQGGSKMKKLALVFALAFLSLAFLRPVGAQVWVNPAPMPTTPATLPTATPGAWAGVQPILYGTGATYISPMCDTFAQSGSIVTAVTTLLITGVANQSVYVCLASWGTSGVNSADTIQFEYGQGATCATNTVT